MLDLVFPRRCLSCGDLSVAHLCVRCLPRHARRVDARIEGIRGAIALGRYHGPLGHVVRAGKYGKERQLMVWLGALLADSVPHVLQREVSSVVPVPSHWMRRLALGFEPATVLAHPVAVRLGVPVLHALVNGSRRRQAGRTRGGRLRRKPFRATRAVTGRVLLLDDVVTTGVTASTCARELLSSGACEVWLAVACHVPDTEVRMF